MKNQNDNQITVLEMKLIITFTFILFTNIQLFAQSFNNDTVIIIYTKKSILKPDEKVKVYDTLTSGNLSEKKVLLGTTVLTGSKNNYYSMLQGLSLKEVGFSECSNDRIRDRNGRKLGNLIKDIQKRDSLWILDLRIVETCCNHFLCEIEYLNDSTLSLNYISYGNNCSCTCCYGLTYYIKNYYCDNIKYFMINNEEKTLRKFEE